MKDWNGSSTIHGVVNVLLLHQRLQCLHDYTLCCSLQPSCFQGGNDSITIHCVVKSTINVSNIAIIAPLHIVLFIVIFLFWRFQWFQYHTLRCSLYYCCIQGCNGCTTTQLCCSLWHFCFKDCIDSSTIHCVVHWNISVPKIAMVAPLHIVLLNVIFLHPRLQWYYYHTLCWPFYNCCIKDCNDCTTAHCVSQCNLSVFKIAMIPIPYIELLIVLSLHPILQWLHHYTLCCSLHGGCIKDCNGCTTTHCVVHCIFCFQSCNDCNTAHCVVHCILLYLIAMIPVPYIVLFSVPLLFQRLQWLYHCTLRCSL